MHATFHPANHIKLGNYNRSGLYLAQELICQKVTFQDRLMAGSKHDLLLPCLPTLGSPPTTHNLYSASFGLKKSFLFAMYNNSWAKVIAIGKDAEVPEETARTDIDRHCLYCLVYKSSGQPLTPSPPPPHASP